MDKAKKFAASTEGLNKSLNRLLDTFAQNTQWSDINQWLLGVESILRENPSPYINQKILFAKRLNQCMNHLLPEETHKCVLRIHQLIFYNMRISVDNNINEYIKLFSEDLGTYSLSILPYFTNTSVTQHRLMCLNILNEFYLDLGLQLIPMLSGIMKSILPVYGQTLDEGLQNQIQKFVDNLLIKLGRKYVVAYLWSSILKFKDCRLAGIKFLGNIIDKMQFIKDQEEYSSSHGFSEEQEELRRELMNEMQPTNTKLRKKSLQIQASSLQILKKEIQKQQRKQKQGNGNKDQKEEGEPKIVRTNTFDPENKKNPLTKIAEEENDDEQHEENDKGSQIQLSLQGVKGQKWQSSHQIKLNKVPLFLSPGLQSIKQGINQNNKQNNFPNHKTLIVNAIITCLQDENQVVRRNTLDFLFSHLRLKSDIFDLQNKKLIIEALIRMFRKNQISVTKRVNRWLFGKENEDNEYVVNEKNEIVLEYIVNAFQKILSTQPNQEETCTLPLKILQNFLIQHVNLIERIIPNVTVSLLRYIFNYGIGMEFSEQIYKAGQRFFQNMPSYYPMILEGLGNKFIESIVKEDEHLSFQCVQYIDFCYLKMMKHDHGIQELQYITIIISKIANGLSEFTVRNKSSKKFYRVFLKDAVLLLYNLLSRKQSARKFKEKQEQKSERKMIESMNYDRLEQEVENEEENYEKKYYGILQNIQTFFNELGLILKVNVNVQIFEQIYRLTSMTIVKVQGHLPKKNVPQALPKWFNTIESGIRVMNPTISLSAIQSMIQCLLSQHKHPIYARFKSLIVEEKIKKIGNDYQSLALQKLWSLLDYPQMHAKIIDLIVAFSKFFPHQFTQTVKLSFNTHNAPEKQAAIQRFSHFWRLTGFKYKDLLISNRQFAEINKVGLFTMLDFLDDQNPLVRHAVKNWLIESMQLFHRILQPLFFQLMKSSCEWYKTPKGIYVIKTIYDTKAIFNSFRRLRSILSNGSYAFLRYIYQTPLTDSLEELREKITQLTQSFLTQDNPKQAPQLTQSLIEREPVLPKALEQNVYEPINQKRLTFMDMLIIISIKYIEGHALESNAGVNTSSIELIETLINYIDSPALCHKIINYTMEPLSRVLNQAVMNKQYITQIQLLNLFKTVLFSSSFRKKGELSEVRTFLRQTFTQESFMQSLLNGLHTPFSYVRSQFINFITICIPLIADFLQPQETTVCVKHILFTYYKLIKQIRISLIQDVLEGDIKYEQQQNKDVGVLRIFQIEQKAKQQEKLVKLSDNLQQVAKTNQILSILHGVSVIMNYFFDFDKININQMKFEFSNPYTFFDTFKTIVTLGLASSEKSGKLIQKTQFFHNLQTCQAILSDLSPVFETALRAWPLSQEYVRIGTQQFSSIGMKNFNFQRFNRYNHVLKKLIVYVKEQKQSIWGKIFSIIQPMFYKFPHEITDIYLNLWVRQCTQSGQIEGQQINYSKPLRIKSNSKNTQFLMKIIQTIIVSNFPMNVLIHAFLESSLVEKIQGFYQNKDKKKNLQSLDYQICHLQSKLLYFLYVYFTHVYISEENLKKDNLLQIWSFIMKVIKPFLPSKAPSTAIWILDFVNMCAKKYCPKQILVNEKFKTDLHGLVNDKLKYIANVASKVQNLFYEDPLQGGFNEEDESKRFRVILPISPTLYQLYKTKTMNKNSTDKQLYRQIRIGNCQQLQQLYRISCFKTLKLIGFEVLQNTYLSDKMHFGIKRACEWMQLLFPSIQDKSKASMIFAECASQVLHNLLQKARILFIKPLRQSILEIFNKDDFFICNERTLKYWTQIIEWVVSIDKNNQTFQLYLSMVNLQSSIFTSESDSNKKRIKCFERICFILYSGCKDKYASKIKFLLQKIADTIKMAQSAHPALLILILFSIRILILKLSQISLKQLFEDIWPMLLAFFMEIFSKKLVKVQIANQISRNPNLLLAALKLIQLISITNLGQFAHHEWIFIYDYFNVKLQIPQTYAETFTQLNEFIARRPQLSQVVSFSKNNSSNCPFQYRPYLLNTLPTHTIQYNNRNSVGKQEQKMVDMKQPYTHAQSPLSYKGMRRKIVVKQSFIQTQQQLKVYALLLSQYLALRGQYRMQIQLLQVQQVIINDFIHLDSFIHKV